MIKQHNDCFRGTQTSSSCSARGVLSLWEHCYDVSCETRENYLKLEKHNPKYYCIVYNYDVRDLDSFCSSLFLRGESQHHHTIYLIPSPSDNLIYGHDFHCAYLLNQRQVFHNRVVIFICNLYGVSLVDEE